MTASLIPAGRRLSPPRPWQRNATLAVVATSIVAGWVGTALFASLVDRHPLVLVSLNATPKYLVLTVNHLDAWSYYGVATARLMVTKPLMWCLGGWYGSRTVAWAARRSERSADLLRWVEAQFGRLGWLIVPITSSSAICLLAGSTGFPLLPFLALALAGTLVRLAIYDAFGERFQDPIDRVVGTITDFRLPIVIASTIAVVVVAWWQHRRGISPFDALAELGRDDEEPPARR